MIGQSQVTDPLMTALRTNRVNHAYLFSGPRGCGKTTSARILARCLNCAEGPTDTPCGVCPSCVELGRDGPGSLDVVEIDAASHNGVDDARDLRERAVFAPARDRFKIFILDEAHMVTPQGFNALLKIVEEPPEHIKFIFATTEPDKVIGTIRSRTHHYPFRLIPPAQLLEYVQHLCDTEGVDVAPGVLPLVVRAGGGSARDTLSLLDQLIAGSENNRVDYERAVALLGYTHGALLAEAIDALGSHDGAAAFDAVDRVIQTGQDPRRFVEDLLERLRDIIIVSATRESASSVLRGVPADEIEAMRRQAALFGHAELSRVADIVNTALSEMTGATSPRLHLELMIARALVPASDDTQRGALVRVERLERRIGVDAPDAGGGAAGVSGGSSAASSSSSSSSPSPSLSSSAASAARSEASGAPARAFDGAAPGAVPVAAQAGWPVTTPGSGADSTRLAPDATSSAAAVVEPPREADSSEAATGSPAPSRAEQSRAGETGAAASGTPVPVEPTPDGAFSGSTASSPATPQSGSAAVAAAAGEVSLQQLKDAWPEILEVVQKAKMTAWLVVYTAQVRALDGDVLTLAFPSENDVASFKERSAPGQGVSEFLRQAILDVLGLRVKYIARVDSSLRPHDEAPAASTPASAPAAAQPPASPTNEAPPAVAPAAGASAPDVDSTPPTNRTERGASLRGGAASSTTSTPASPVPPRVAGTPDTAPADSATQGQPSSGAPSAVNTDGDDLDDPDELDDDDNDLPPEEPLPPEPRAIVDASGWAVPGLNENTAAPITDTAADAATDSAEVARMRAQLASLKGAAQNPAPTQRPSSAQTSSSPPVSAPSAGRPPAQASAPAQRPTQPPRDATRAPDAAGRRPPAPTTTWDVVAIPTSSSEEPPPFDEPMPSDEPDLPPSLADIMAHGDPSSSASAGRRAPGGPDQRERTAPGGPAQADASRAPRAGDPAARPGALRFAASGPEPDAETQTSPTRNADAPSAPAAASAPPSTPPATSRGRARYGEAVVREILGANFIEEQPLPGRDG
ncbi:DNA polymerase III subunit gamma and tau [Herbiconiux daphne]